MNTSLLNVITMLEDMRRQLDFRKCGFEIQEDKICFWVIRHDDLQVFYWSTYEQILFFNGDFRRILIEHFKDYSLKNV